MTTERGERADPGGARPDAGRRGADARLRRVLVVALLPGFLFAIGAGAVGPVIPSIVVALGGSLQAAAFIAGALALGGIAGDLPAGALIARIGERRAMLLSAAAGLLLDAGCLLARDPWTLFGLLIVMGACGSTFALARHAYLTVAVPAPIRARTLSTLGGTFRAGAFIGPFITALLLADAASPQLSFWVAVAADVAVIATLLVTPDLPEPDREPVDGVAALGAAADADPLANAPEGAVGDDPAEPAAAGPAGIFRTMRNERGTLARIGSAVGIIVMLRTARLVLLPVWGISIGLDDGAIALVVGIAGGVDFALFFASGWIMDRFGRAACAVPSTAALGLGFAALAFTHDLASAPVWFAVISMFLGLANGLGSGLVMTLGADAAPKRRPAPFLAVWHFITDAPAIVIPFLVSGLSALAGLPAVAAALGLLGVLGAILMARYVPRVAPRARRAPAER